MQVNLADGRMLILERIVGVLGPIVRCSDDDSMREVLLTRSRKETVDVTFLNAIVIGEEFALDGVELPRALSLSHEINTDVALIESLLLGPLRIGQHFSIEIAVR